MLHACSREKEITEQWVLECNVFSCQVKFEYIPKGRWILFIDFDLWAISVVFMQSKDLSLAAITRLNWSDKLIPLVIILYSMFDLSDPVTLYSQHLDNVRGVINLLQCSFKALKWASILTHGDESIKIETTNTMQIKVIIMGKAYFVIYSSYCHSKENGI